MTKWIVIFAVLIGLLIGLMFLFTSQPEADIRFSNTTAHATMDPQRCDISGDFLIIGQIYETLIKVGVPSLELEPGVAKSWSVSKDKLTYTFKLRDNAKWSNGDPVTAQDFAFAWRRGITPDLAAYYSTEFFFIKGAKSFYKWRSGVLAAYGKGRPSSGDGSGSIDKDASEEDKIAAKYAPEVWGEHLKDFKGPSAEAAAKLWEITQKKLKEEVGIAAPDKHTLVVTLEHPTAFFLELCAFGTYSPVHQPSVRAKLALPDANTGMVLQDASWTAAEISVTNGPYMLKEHVPKSHLLMAANPHYWNRAAMQNSSVLEKHIPDENSSLLAYKKGELNWLPNIPTNTALAADLIAERDRKERNDVFTSAGNGTYYLRFNCRPQLWDGRDNPFANPKVRQAFSMAIDRKTLVEKITRVFQPISKTFVPVGVVPDYDPPQEAGISFDAEAARKLLADAGYPGGKGLEGIELLYNTGGGHKEPMTFVSGQWKKHLGVEVNMRAMEFRIVVETLQKGEFMVARSGWLGDYRDARTFLHLLQKESGQNNGKYVNEKYDQLFDDAAKEPDAQKRREMLQEAEAIMLRDQPVAPLYQYTNLELWRPDELSGLLVNPWNHRRLETVKVLKK